MTAASTTMSKKSRPCCSPRYLNAASTGLCLVLPLTGAFNSSTPSCASNFVSITKRLTFRKIYIRTQHAWYILLNPARAYTPYHRDFDKYHVITHTLLTHSLKQPTLSADGLLKCLDQHFDQPVDSADLSSSGYVSSVDRTSRKDSNSSESVQSQVAYLTLVMDKLAEDDHRLWKRLRRGHLISSLCPSPTSGRSSSSSFAPSSARSSLSPRPSFGRKYRPLKDIEKDVLQHADHTVVTPRVGAIADGLFSQSLRVVHMTPDLEHISLAEPPPYRTHADDPHSLKWIEATDDPHVFRSVSIDGEVYAVRTMRAISLGIILTHSCRPETLCLWRLETTLTRDGPRTLPQMRLAVIPMASPTRSGKSCLFMAITGLPDCQLGSARSTTSSRRRVLVAPGNFSMASGLNTGRRLFSRKQLTLDRSSG